MDLVVTTLQKLGPCISARLVDALVKDHGFSPVAARQRVSRCKQIKRLGYLPFPRNARFVYLQSDYGSPTFWGALSQALLENSLAYGGAIAALLARSGTTPLAHFAIACGAPIAQRGHVSATAILERLTQAKLVQVVDIAGIGPCVQLSQQIAPPDYEVARLRARLHAEEILLAAIKDWARKLGLVSYEKVAVRHMDSKATQPKVGTFAWDLTAPSYLAPMAEWLPAGPKPGFLACDVLLGAAVSATHLKPFLTKCRTLRSLKRVGRCLQMFVAEGFEPEAFTLAKSAGIVPATPATLFGEDVAKALIELAALLSETFVGPNTLDRVEMVFSRLGKIEGAAINLRGALFEFVVAEMARRTSANTSITMNRILASPHGRTAEVDVLVERRDHSIRFIECRGYKPGGTVDDSLVDRWLDDRIPLLREAAAAERFWSGHNLEFEFWTTGVISDAARAKIAQIQATVRPGKFSVQLFDGSRIRDLAQQIGDKRLVKTLEEHFFEHPLSTLKRDIERLEARQRLRARTTLPKREPVDMD